MGRRRRLLEERRNFLRRAEITMRQNLAAILSFFATRDSGVRRFWVIPRPQHWFDMLLSRRDLDSEWPKHFRMSRQTFMKLVEIVGPQMTGQDSRFRSATPVEKKVAAALWRLATGNSYRCIGISLGIGTSNAWLCTVKFCEVNRLNRLRCAVQSRPHNPITS